MNKRLLIAVPALLAFAFASPAFAGSSSVAGTISTGVSTGLSGIVDAAPLANPGEGTYTSAQSVTLSAAGADSVHYTIDDSTPTCATGTVYSGAIDVSSSETIKAVACYSGAGSTVSTFAYGINLPAAPSGSGGSGGSGSSGGNGGGGGSGGGPIIPTPLVGDINGDSHVDLLDFNLLMSAWGQTGPSLLADLNHDGVVDILDFNILMAHWTG